MCVLAPFPTGEKKAVVWVNQTRVSITSLEMTCGIGYISYMVSPTASYSTNLHSLPSLPLLLSKQKKNCLLDCRMRLPDFKSMIRDGRIIQKRRGLGIIASSSNVASPSIWDDWKPAKSSSSPFLSDILWPSAGGFVAMALLGKMDQILAQKGISMTIAPLGAVSAVLFATPLSPAARKYNIFMAQIGCAAIGVLAFTVLGPGWLARAAALSACIAYMIFTGAIHPPAASLPLLFIDGVKLHHLNFWYALFPGAAGCILLCLIQEVVVYLKDNFKF